MTPLFRMFMVALLTVLFTEECCGHMTENCRYQNCSHTITYQCDSGILVPVCISISSTEVTWYYGQTENSTSEQNITAGATCILKKEPGNNANCSDLRLYQYELETNSAPYLCHIVTHRELSKKNCTVKSTSNSATACDSGLPVCACCRSQTDSQFVIQVASTPVLSLTTLLSQSNSTGLASATSEPTPSVPSSTSSPSVTTSQVQTPSVPSTSSTPPSEIYLAVGLGALAVIVVLLVVVIIVLVCISVTRGKKKMQGTEKAPEEELHTYDVVTQPMKDETGPNDQQHIYDRTQHPGIVDKTEQTHDEYCQENTTTQEYEHLHNTRQRSRREEAKGRTHDYEQEQNESKTPPSHENLYHVLDGPIEVSSSKAFTTTTADMYSTPNFSSKGAPQSPASQDHFYHVLEGPTSSTGTSMYSNTDRSTALGKKKDNGDYDEPIFPTGNKAGHQLFDDPLYQRTFAPVMSTQSHTLPQKLPDEIKLLPNLAYASPVEDQDKTAINDSSYQVSAVTSPAKPTEGKWNDMQAFCKDSQEDDYDQPTAITIKSKELNSNEGGDQPVLFDDPTYQVASAPV